MSDPNHPLSFTRHPKAGCLFLLFALLLSCSATQKATGVSDADDDGVADKVDACPALAEDIDNFQDQDGCPDPDNDQDLIEDKVDACPNEPEHRNGFEDADGCPDVDPNTKRGAQAIDQDGDRIVDAEDRCPMEPENINGIDDSDGCPEPPRITIQPHPPHHSTERVYFDKNSAQITARYKVVLDAVVEILKKNPSITVAVEGHCDKGERKPAALSKERAEAVVVYLTDAGIPADRLVAKAEADQKPLAKPPNAKNRRIEFRIISKDK